MELTNFKLGEHARSFSHGDNNFDLHNNFSFLGFSYETFNRKIELNWRKRDDEWVPNDSPEKIQLIIEDVAFLKASERYQDMPFTEDDCLSTIGFMWNDMIEEMGAYYSSEPIDDCNHLSISFMSGFDLKISAERATLFVE